MQLIRTTHFKRDYRKLPSSIQKRADEKLKLLAQNLSHPSLRVKRARKYKGVFEGSITKDYRILVSNYNRRLYLTSHWQARYFRKRII